MIGLDLMHRRSSRISAAFVGLAWILTQPGFCDTGPLEGPPLRLGAADDPAPESLGGFVFSTYAGIPSPAFGTTTFEATDLPFAATVVEADDFVVDGHGWRIDAVEVRGVYFDFSGSSGPADSVNVYFLRDGGGGFPDTTDVAGSALAAYPARNYVDIDDGDFRVVLVDDMGNPAPLVLPPGTYWLVVQPRMALLTNGLWGWTESAFGGEESVFMQNTALVQGTDGMAHCDDGNWGRRITDCLITQSGPGPFEYDAAFRFEGEALTPGFALSSTNLQTSEAGLVATFDVVLDAPPSDPVTIPIGSAPASEGVVSPTMLVFDAGNWDVPQTVTITPVDDAIPEPDVPYLISSGPASSLDLGYDGLAFPMVGVENLDDDSAGLTVDPLTGLSLTEAGTAGTIELSLDAPLGAGETVTVPLSVSPAGVATVPASVVFSQADGTDPISVSVTPGDDDVFDGPTAFTVVTGDPTSNNAIYDALGAGDVPDTTGTRLEDDVVGVSVTVMGGAPLTTTEAGAMGSFTVSLTSEPLAEVALQIVTSDAGEGSLSTALLSFDAGSWSVPQVVEVTGLDDDFDDGDQSYTLAIPTPTGSGDPFYATFDPPDVSVVNVDDDTAGFDMVPIAVEVSEAGTETMVAIRLTAQPIFDVAPVRLPLVVDDPSEAEISVGGGPFGDAGELLFSQAAWDVDQFVTVRGVDDPLFDGDRPFSVLTGDITGGDLAYADLEPQDVPDIQGVNLDDEEAVDVPVEVPSLGGVGMLLTVLLLALASLSTLRRRET